MLLSHLNCALSCIFDPLPSGLEHCINPPEPRWPDATAHRINYRLHCIIIIDWSVSLSVCDLETLNKHKSLLIPSHNASGARLHLFFPPTAQGFRVSYDLNTLFTKTSVV